MGLHLDKVQRNGVHVELNWLRVRERTSFWRRPVSR